MPGEPGGEGDTPPYKRQYKREFSVLIDVKDNSKVKAKPILAASLNIVGHGNILACVPRAGNLYELTFKDKYSAEAIDDGLFVNGEQFEATQVVQDTYTVSFMNLPVYIEDSVLNDNLEKLGVEKLSAIKRRYYEYTEIEDGTRYCRVRFPPTLKSLPFTIKLFDGEKYNYYRVIHNTKKKTCSVCGSDAHLRKTCPDLIC